MPSRNHTSNATSKKSKFTGPRVIIPIKKKKPKKKLEVHVNENSSPVEILHASWEFISAFQFFYTFNAYFHLPKDLSIQQLEEALVAGKDEEPVPDEHVAHLKRESSVLSQQSSQSGGESLPVRNYLANFMVHIISPLLTPRQQTLINQDNYEQFVADVFPDYSNFANMHIIDKIKVLKSIEMAHVEIADPDLLALQVDKSSKALRVSPLGTDCEGWVYWYFGHQRLYREVPLVIGKKGPDALEFSFELVCYTIEQWKETIEKLKSVKRPANKKIAKTVNALGAEVIVEIEAKEKARLAHEAKMKRARELELMPKKRSRRLEVKFEEQVKRQKLLDEEREQAELEALASQKEAEQAEVMIEKCSREIQKAEISLRKNLRAFITDLMVAGHESKAAMQPLTTLVNTKTPLHERLAKMQGWIRLLEGSISMELSEEDGTIQFVGESVDTALVSVLFTSAMAVYLNTLMLLKLNPISVAFETADQTYADLILDHFENIESFTLALNNIITSITDKAIREDVVQFLAAIFAPDVHQIAEAQQPERGVEEAKVDELEPGINGVHDPAAALFDGVGELSDSNSISSDDNKLGESISSTAADTIKLDASNTVSTTDVDSADVEEIDEYDLVPADTDATTDNCITDIAPSLHTSAEITTEITADPPTLKAASTNDTVPHTSLETLTNELPTSYATLDNDTTVACMETSPEKLAVDELVDVQIMESVAWLDSVNTTDSLKISVESSLETDTSMSAASVPHESL
ncbi:hypothetical protein [Parasitella parasitica]|uniref:DDT domain-containing protein n=1 Tax=Parasitella parasitica TaxID=35722 RepID=A0A0B7NVR0_9FUNG|nr:hypothetical protein [Parasitella parasitica]